MSVSSKPEAAAAMHRTNHYITQLKRTKIPNHHLCLDSEARIVKVAGRFEHRFACAATMEVSRWGNRSFVARYLCERTDLDYLWGMVGGVASDVGELVLWAHNLPYDLRVTDGLRHLLRLGWTLENISIARTTSWATWRKGKAKLTMCDSYSWLHTTMERYAGEMGQPVAKRAYASAWIGQLQKWCAVDCALLARAVCDLLNFIADEDLGNFRPTGSGQSHAAWRRRFMPELSVRVHDNTRALTAEREAMHTGRAEAWRVGDVKGPIYEVDLELAYCRIAAENALPQILTAERATLSDVEFHALSADFGILADVTVTTDQPLVPVRRGDRTLWPIGTFRTTLWDPELNLLIDNGAKIDWHYAWLYKPGYALQDMSRWLIDQMHRPVGELPVAVGRMLKHWARTLVGRMALRYRQWEYFGEHPREGLHASYEPDPATGETNKHLHIGHTMFELAAMTETKSSCPMIPGWVQSRCRAILWELIKATSEENVLYMDTDGLLVTAAGLERIHYHGGDRHDWHCDTKAMFDRATIHGVRNVDLPGDRRLAGIPKAAIATSDITWEGETWTGLERALEEGHTDYVGVVPATWTVVPENHRRELLKDGRTRPYKLGDPEHE